MRIDGGNGARCTREEVRERDLNGEIPCAKSVKRAGGVVRNAGIC